MYIPGPDASLPEISATGSRRRRRPVELVARTRPIIPKADLCENELTIMKYPRSNWLRKHPLLPVGDNSAARRILQTHEVSLLRYDEDGQDKSCESQVRDSRQDWNNLPIGKLRTSSIPGT